MKNVFLLAFLIPLSGCAPLFQPIDISTTTSRNTLFGIVNGYGVALSAENAYKNLCVQDLADKDCRSTILKMQAADSKAVKTMGAANDFIKKYPTVSAENLIDAAKDAVDDFKKIAGAQ